MFFLAALRCVVCICIELMLHHVCMSTMMDRLYYIISVLSCYKWSAICCIFIIFYKCWTSDCITLENNVLKWMRKLKHHFREICMCQGVHKSLFVVIHENMRRELKDSDVFKITFNIFSVVDRCFINTDTNTYRQTESILRFSSSTSHACCCTYHIGTLIRTVTCTVICLWWVSISFCVQG